MESEYLRIMENGYEDFSNYYEGAISFEQWNCYVDIRYRKEFGKFPNEDDKMVERLKEAMFMVGSDLMRKQEEDWMEIETEERIRKMSKRLAKKIDAFLEFKRRRIKLGFPWHRRFSREEIWNIEEEEWDEDEYEEEDHWFWYALESLIDEGMYRLVEKGSEPKFDVFQAVEV